MIARIWRTKVDPARVEEYERFARSRSHPMFRTQRGFLGVAFMRRGDDCAVLTLWRGLEDVEALAASPSYQETVRAIQAEGFLRGASTVEWWNLEPEHLGLEPALPASGAHGIG